MKRTTKDTLIKSECAEIDETCTCGVWEISTISSNSWRNKWRWLVMGERNAWWESLISPVLQESPRKKSNLKGSQRFHKLFLMTTSLVGGWNLFSSFSNKNEKGIGRCCLRNDVTIRVGDSMWASPAIWLYEQEERKMAKIRIFFSIKRRLFRCICQAERICGQLRMCVQDTPIFAEHLLKCNGIIYKGKAVGVERFCTTAGAGKEIGKAKAARESLFPGTLYKDLWLWRGWGATLRIGRSFLIQQATVKYIYSLEPDPLYRNERCLEGPRAIKRDFLEVMRAFLGRNRQWKPLSVKKQADGCLKVKVVANM